MPFNQRGLAKSEGSYNSDVYNLSSIFWKYKSSDDTLATILSPSYFESVDTILTVGDGIYISASDGSLIVTVSSTAPLVTVSPLNAQGFLHKFVVQIPFDGGSTGIIQAPAVPFGTTGAATARLKGIRITGDSLNTGNIELNVERNTLTLVNNIN